MKNSLWIRSSLTIVLLLILIGVWYFDVLHPTIISILLALGSYDGITDKLFDIIHHKGAFYYGN